MSNKNSIERCSTAAASNSSLSRPANFRHFWPSEFSRNGGAERIVIPGWASRMRTSSVVSAPFYALKDQSEHGAFLPAQLEFFVPVDVSGSEVAQCGSRTCPRARRASTLLVSLARVPRLGLFAWRCTVAVVSDDRRTGLNLRARGARFAPSSSRAGRSDRRASSRSTGFERRLRRSVRGAVFGGRGGKVSPNSENIRFPVTGRFAVKRILFCGPVDAPSAPPVWRTKCQREVLVIKNKGHFYFSVMLIFVKKSG